MKILFKCFTKGSSQNFSDTPFVTQFWRTRICVTNGVSTLVWNHCFKYQVRHFNWKVHATISMKKSGGIYPCDAAKLVQRIEIAA